MLRPYVGPEELQTMAALEDGLHCPRCTAGFSTQGFASAFWAADAIVYFCWCGACGWRGELTELQVITTYEAAGASDEPDDPRSGVIGRIGAGSGARPRRRASG